MKIIKSLMQSDIYFESKADAYREISNKEKDIIGIISSDEFAKVKLITNMIRKSIRDEDLDNPEILNRIDSDNYIDIGSVIIHNTTEGKNASWIDVEKSGYIEYREFSSAFDEHLTVTDYTIYIHLKIK